MKVVELQLSTASVSLCDGRVVVCIHHEVEEAERHFVLGTKSW